MASSLGYGSCWGQMKEFSSMRNYSKKREFRISCTVHSDVLSDPYKTLRIHRGASEPEVKKAFRKLALQYHPDVCRESNCDVKFHQINEAYNMLINNLRGEPSRMGMEMSYEDQYDEHQETTGVNDQDWELWEEWMGWEGAGIRDYSSHINPYI